ncbi:MAG: hypothetical protein R3C14_41890 [Caldilineaceae bacterium]
MQLNQTRRNLGHYSLTDRPLRRAQRWVRLRSWLFCALVLIATALLNGRSTITATEAQQQRWSMVASAWNFDLVGWESGAVLQKIDAFLTQPARGLSYVEAVSFVRSYLDRAQSMGQKESEINRILSANNGDATAETQKLQAELEALRAIQQAERPTVEQTIEGQIAFELRREGIEFAGQAFPPVQFAFVEPPRKLVVSPRDHIATIYSQMLDAEMSLEEIRASEATYRSQYNLSAYITNIGGLGAFPTMVVDQAGLQWILSTVAHEWTHNYLSLFPLGMNYLTSSDLTTINETVAEIVGNEFGDRALVTFYPDLVPPPATEPPAALEPGSGVVAADEHPFDFQTEMRETRLTVDKLLARGWVEDAETYMEARRIYFVENGYPLRVLNQAYFAFHGSYGTSPASSSPLGPKLERLRALTPNLHTFLQAVRTIDSPAALDRTLDSWETRERSRYTK